MVGVGWDLVGYGANHAGAFFLVWLEGAGESFAFHGFFGEDFADVGANASAQFFAVFLAGGFKEGTTGDVTAAAFFVFDAHAVAGEQVEAKDEAPANEEVVGDGEFLAQVGHGRGHARTNKPQKRGVNRIHPHPNCHPIIGITPHQRLVYLRYFGMFLCQNPLRVAHNGVFFILDIGHNAGRNLEKVLHVLLIPFARIFCLERLLQAEPLVTNECRPQNEFEWQVENRPDCAQDDVEHGENGAGEAVVIRFPMVGLVTIPSPIYVSGGE